MTHKLKIAVTGSTGYIGHRFMRAALMMGHQVISLSRQPGVPESIWIKYNLASSEPVNLPSDINVLVHLAANTSFHGELSDREEIHAAINILNAAKAGDMKFIFISSQTARKDAPTAYGRTKYQIEQLVINSGGIVIRPGLVYGGRPHGLYGELLRLVDKFYFLPYFIPAPRIQPIHVDDLAIGILKVAEYSSVRIGPVVMLGSTSSVSFSYFLRCIARCRLRVSRIYIPVPSIIIHLLAGIFEKIGGGLNRLNSLFNLVDMKTTNDLHFLDLKLRQLSSGLNSSGSNSRRQILIEGFAFHAYIVGKRIKKINVRNYVRIIERVRKGDSLQLPLCHQTWPFWIALFDDKKIEIYPWVKEFKWRLRAATLLAEASTTGAIKFIDPMGGGFVSSLFGILSSLTSEVFLKILRLLLTPLIQFILIGKLKENHDS